MHPSLPATPLLQSWRRSSAWLAAIKAAGIYLIAATAWVFVSHYGLTQGTAASPELVKMGMAQSLGFVAVSAGLLLLVIRYFLQRLLQAESLRWAQQPQFRALLEQSLVGVYLIQDNRFAYVNPRLAAIFGYATTDMIGQVEVKQVVASTDQVMVAEKLDRLLQSPSGDWHHSFRGLHRNGWPLQLEVLGSRTEHQGRPAVIGTLLDVTDRHEAESALRESEERYRLLIQTAPDAIVVLDIELGRFVDYNPQAELLFELPGEKMSLYGPAELSPEFQPDGRRSVDKAREYLAQAVAGGLPAFEWVHRSQSGREFPCEIRLARLTAEGRTLVRGSITDITERYRTAAALARSEENYRLLFEHATDAILIFATDARLVDVNRPAVNLTGYSREELLGKSAFDIIAAADHEYLRHCLHLLFAEGTRFNTYRFSRKDGTTFFGETNTKLLPDGRLLALVRDITDQRQAEEHRQKLEEELRHAQKLQAIGTLAGGIAHDFNNILAAILGNAQLLKLMLAPDHEGHGKVSQILVASNRAKDLVQQILMFSRQREQEKRVLQLGAVVVEAGRLIEVTMEPSIKLELAIPSNLPTVLADSTQIHQVVVNLCANAVHAMRAKGGTVKVALSAVSLPEDVTESQPSLRPGRYVRLRVSDNGHGMDAATMERIYEPFFTTKSVGDGTGLGLAVVHGIVEAHNGAITVVSTPGVGTTFTLYFPSNSDLAAPEAPAAEGALQGKGQRILFVDDETPITEVAEIMILRLGYQVTVFTKSTEALAYLRENFSRIDLLMTDLSMPGLTGVELIREAGIIKPGLPSILLTGYGKSFDSRSANGLNIREVITKPFTMDALAGSIQAALTPVQFAGEATQRQ
jgi:two-component system, cell cycle sensor histidine kinase and response regulator CckA